MISQALLFFRDQLEEYLRANSDWLPDQIPEEKKVVFLDAEAMNPLRFKKGAVTALLINLEEEKTLRPPDRYQRSRPDGTTLQVRPEVRLNLYLLFVARFDPYEQGLHYLSLIIRYFQGHPVLDHTNAPQLGDDIEQLVSELVTLPLAQQNVIWSQLRTPYHPSVLYRVRMLAFRDEEGVAAPEVVEARVAVRPSS